MRSVALSVIVDHVSLSLLRCVCAPEMVDIFALLAAVILPLVIAQKEGAQEATSLPLSDHCVSYRMLLLFCLLTSGVKCTTLSLSPLKDRVLYPNQSDYESRLRSYFDIKQQTITPNCILQPRSTEEVSLAVKILTTRGGLKPCSFAIRSGGHTPYAGASNIKDGVTIDLQYISAVEYDDDNDLVKVGPGARWNDVFTTLEPLGVITTGGRSSSVGVGGLTLGGGISYFSPEHGLICDNVLEFEVVLADGRIVTASQTMNPDLFTVLKGGNNNFGIVTAFKFRTFPYHGMWGGLVTYPNTTVEAQFEALVNFAKNMDKDVKGAVIIIPAYISSVGIDIVLNTYDYAEPVERPSAYNEFLAIPGNISDTTGLRNMSSLAKVFEGATTHR
jgi:FAD/FMN-containing dehydrogenase